MISGIAFCHSEHIGRIGHQRYKQTNMRIQKIKTETIHTAHTHIHNKKETTAMPLPPPSPPTTSNIEIGNVVRATRDCCWHSAKIELCTIVDGSEHATSKRLDAARL